MTPVDPVVRAKLADWLGAEFRRRSSWSACDEDVDDASAVADALLGLPPSVRAQLVGLEDGVEAERNGLRAVIGSLAQHRELGEWERRALEAQ